DGTIGAAAGAEFRLGREARREFNESLAPEEADNLTQGSSLLFRARDVGRPVPFTPPPWAEDYPTEESLYHRHHSPYNRREYAGYWWIEVGAPFDTIDQNEEICAEALRHLLGVWDHIKNHGEHGAENLALDWIGMLPGKRESRRLIGDYILTEHDVRQNQPFPDRVAYGGWFIDLHTMGGILAQDQPPEALSGNPDLSDQLRIQPYSIPLRCLYSRNIENLFMAGRDISVTHVALGTTRLMLTCAVLGQAVGTAASLCLKYRVTPRTLAQEQVAQLQQTLLKDDCFILNLPNQDPADLAPRATVSATSSAPLMLEPSGGSSSLERYRAQIFPVTAERLETLSLHLESSLDREAEVKVELLPATDIWSFNESRSEPPLTATATVPAGYKGWVDFHLGAATERRLYQVNVYGCAGLAWTQTKPVPGVAAASRKPAWQRWASEKAMYALRPYPPAAPFGPENLISGVARPEKWTNLWMSDPAAKLPQAVTLDFREEVTFDTVYLTFDTFLHLDFDHFPPLYRIPECGRDYALQVWEAGGWKTVVEVEGNYQRRRVHRFAPVTARQLRLEVRATNGDPSARVYEIRVYREGDQ
ncbi:MAG TPA: FAD-dependent oxidoreductase, partial [Armatimonadetes bacterium]|nr:FAD-dependent oxidoreductase [Armatimonadota bacterium]